MFLLIGVEANIKKVFYDYDEVLVYTRYPVSHDTMLTSKYNGLIHIIQPREHSFTYSTATTQLIALNKNLSYFISFIDPQFSFVSVNPETLPRTLIQVKPNAGQLIMFIKVNKNTFMVTFISTISYTYIWYFTLISYQVTYHSKLNRPSSQCEESEDYKYSDCLNRKMASIVGCQTFSTNFPDLSQCSTYEEYTNFSSVYEHFNNLEKNDLQAQSGCLRPCKYLEYRVTFTNVKNFSIIIIPSVGG